MTTENSHQFCYFNFADGKEKGIFNEYENIVNPSEFRHNGNDIVEWLRGCKHRTGIYHLSCDCEVAV